ncbi:MAG: acyl--CoA ligase [Deltaproteobacteria bacterium]|nr:acyl--CoA ligase [Deltaproteobacteria bacterium]
MRKLLDYLGISPQAVDDRYRQRPAYLREMLLDTCRLHPDKAAMIDAGQRLTYDALRRQTETLSAAFQHDYSIKKGDRIAILLPNGVGYAVAYLAAAQLGAFSVCLNTRCSASELEFMIRDASPNLLIAHSDLLQRIEKFALEYFTPDRIVITDTDARSDRFASLSDLIAQDRRRPADFPPIDDSDISGLMYTSGTTGRPKGAQISHGNIIANSVVLSVCYLCAETDIDLVLAPMFHVMGLHGQLMRAIYMGSTCVIAEKFSPATAMQTIQPESVNVCVAVPTIFWLMMVNPDFEAFDLSSLKRIIYGGSPASENFIKSIHARFPQALQINAYGLTECTSVATVLPHSEALRKIGSIGLATPFSCIGVIDAAGRNLPPETVGELVIKSPQICLGYWQHPEATADTFRQGWMHTGDLVKIDPEGFVYLMDRKKDMIIRGGENIYSIEVENTLYEHPKILEAAVVGVPDPIFGEQVKACVVLKNRETADAEEIRRHCAAHLADYKVPRFIEFYASLPRNSADKIIKEKLLSHPNGRQ